MESSERNFRAEADEAKAAQQHREGGFVSWSRTPFACLLGVALLLLVLCAFFLAVIQDHKSALQICAQNGGSYEAAYQICTMPGEDSTP